MKKSIKEIAKRFANPKEAQAFKNTMGILEAFHEGADRELVQSQGEQALLWEEELEEELASERDAWEAALEAAAPVDLDELDDRDDEILAEQETLYCRELLTLSN